MSQQLKHTRGPWRLSHNGYYPIVDKELYPGHTMGICGPIHGYYHAPGFAENQAANARLIAAAPDLLEALMYARRFLKPQDHDLAFVDAAIEKATQSKQ